MGILSGNPQNEPMHYGEIYHVWAFAHAAQSALTACQTWENHAGDKDLQDLLDDMIKNMIKQEIADCESLLTNNGITPPPGMPKKPKAKLDEIPAGARITDQEIAASAVMTVSTGLVACSTIIGQCIREDIAATFAKFHTNNLAFNNRILQMKKDKGWLIPPPLHLQTPETVGV